MRSAFSYIIVTFVAFFIIGCAGGSKPYIQQGEKNLTVYSKTDSGVSTTLEIYKIEGKCKKSLEGEIRLKEKTQFSLLENEVYFLRVKFDSLSLLSGATSMGLGSYVQVSPRYDYIIKAEYIDDMYDVVFIKKDKRTNRTREMKIIPLERCNENSDKPFVEINWFPALNKKVEI